jgi:hypothetical protein
MTLAPPGNDEIGLITAVIFGKLLFIVQVIRSTANIPTGRRDVLPVASAD